MNRINTKFRLSCLILLYLPLMALLGGCRETERNVTDAPANTGDITNSQSPAPSVGSGLPVTMPLIDAMFADESFRRLLKQELQLSDDELTRIEDAAKNEVLKLGSDAAEDDVRSTRTSVRDTRAIIEGILGKERAERFFEIVRSRWASDSQDLTLIRPNEVPTDSRIVVNAPAYRMDVFKDGQLVKTYKVGIGYPEFPLPTGLRRASEIIFNPTWTPPDEPWVKDKVRPGKKVEAGSKLNPLGPIKIPIGLPSLIHGGKDPSRLGTFASHGCVGLTSPMVQDFAIRLASLGETPLSVEDVTGYEKNKTETKELKLAKPVPVELRYETIVVHDGGVTIYRDVYERGTNTEENLRKVLESYDVNFDQLPADERLQLTDALDQMAVDATGDVVTEPADSAERKKKRSSGKVTRNIKGQKEIVVPITVLNGKGYPLPVDLAER